MFSIEKLDACLINYVIENKDLFSVDLAFSLHKSPTLLNFEDILLILSSNVQNSEKVIFFTNLLSNSFDRFFAELINKNPTEVNQIGPYTFILLPFLTSDKFFCELSNLYINSNVKLNYYINILKVVLESESILNEKKIELLERLSKNSYSSDDPYNFKMLLNSIPYVDLKNTYNQIIHKEFKKFITLDCRSPFTFRFSLQMDLYSRIKGIPSVCVMNNFQTITDLLLTLIDENKYLIEEKLVEIKNNKLKILVTSFDKRVVESLNSIFSFVEENTINGNFLDTDMVFKNFLRYYLDYGLTMNNVCMDVKKI